MRKRLYQLTLAHILAAVSITCVSAQTLTITGPTKVDAGSYQDYSASSSCGSGNIFCWSGTNGTITTLTTCGAAMAFGGGGAQPLTSGCNQCYTQTMHWNNVTTLQTGTVSASTNGGCISSGSLTVTLVPALNTSAVSLSPTQQFVALNGAATIVASGTPTGGDGTYYYYWDSSADSTNWTMNIAAGSSFSPSSNTGGKTYYRLRLISFDYVAYFYASVTVLDPGSISSAQTTVAYNNAPAISASGPVGGNCAGSYIFQWQQSTNNGVSWGNIGGNVANYPGNFLSYNTLIRRQVICGTVTTYSNILPFTVNFAAGFITVPGLVNASTTFTITGTAPTGGDASAGYSYQWESSTDGITFTTISGATSQNYTKTGGVAALTWYRRKDINGTPYLYTNFSRVKINLTSTLIKPNGTNAPSSTQTAVPIPSYGNLIDTNKLNFVRIREFTKPGILDTVTADTVTDIYATHQTTQYFDGLGRLIQTVSKQATPSQKDLVVFNVYDGFGRVQQQYLPYSDVTATGNFKTNIATSQPSFYNNLYNNIEGFYYTATTFEASSASPILKQASPGKSFTGSLRGQGIDVKVNTGGEDVKIWFNDVSPDSTIPRVVGSYAAGTLVEKQSVDVNGNEMITYTDLNGKLILSKQEISDTLQQLHTGWLCTYYVYDYFGNQRFVIPPKAVQYLSQNNWALTATIANELCYRYSYDQRKRMIFKKIPGAGEIWIVYDARDRAVMTQDSLLRSQGKWTVISYDSENRTTKTTLWTDSHNRSFHQILATNSTSYPTLTGTYKTLSENFYDDYSWKSRSDIAISGHAFTTKFTNTTDLPVIQISSYAVTPASTAETRSLSTGTRVKVLDPNNDSLFTYSIILYDDHNRVVQIHASNLTGGWDTATTEYDFGSRILVTAAAHSIVSNSGPIKWNEVVTAFNYDHAGRILQTKKYINRSTSAENISSYAYDELGRGKTKSLGNAPLEVQNYDYTLQGWMKGINKGYADSSTSTSHWFGFDISYDYGFSQNQFNGNIAGVVWKTQGDDSAKAYGYNYDNNNRILKADFTQQIGGGYSKGNQLDFNVDSLQYDYNGNILLMQQKGVTINSPSVIDHLSYTYQQTGALSNKLASVTDNSGNTAPLGDFKDSTNTGDDYSYDGNGNQILDNNKHVNNIVYNILNLPQTIYFKGRGTINYIYDAAGNKVRKITIDSTAGASPKIDTVTYAGLFIYDHDTLQLIGHEEGRIRPKLINPTGGWTTSNIQYVYDYFLKDHLGNVRVVLSEEGQTDTYAATMETKNATLENAIFDSVSSTQYAKPTGFDSSIGADTSNHYVSRLNASSSVNKRVGPTILLKVMAGDTLSVSTFAWYSGAVQQPGSQPSLLNSLSTLLADDAIGLSSGKLVQAQESAVSTAAGPALTSFLTYKDAQFNNTAPKAFLNWALLDERFNYVQGGVTQITTITAGQSRQVLTALLPATISKNGYLYVYVSNESPQDVYFDQLTVQHHRGPLVEEEHYYPFGMKMASISSSAALRLENRYKYNSKELQRQEFSDSKGLEEYDYGARYYDVQIGRWNVLDPLADKYLFASPYSYTINNPIKLIDPDGMKIDITPGSAYFTGQDAIDLFNTIMDCAKDGKTANLFMDDDNFYENSCKLSRGGAWDVDNCWDDYFIEKYSSLVQGITAILANNGQKYTCEDFALTVIATFAKDNHLPFKFITGFKTFDASSNDYNNFDDFLHDLKKYSGAPDLQNDKNTVHIGINDLTPGSLILLESAESGKAHHAQVVTFVDRDDDNLVDRVDVMQGNFGPSWRPRKLGSADPSSWWYYGARPQTGYWDLFFDTFTNFTTGTTTPNFSWAGGNKLEFRNWNFLGWNK